MRAFTIVFVFLFVRQCGAKATRDVDFGPQNCVSLSRSAAGSCVLSTDCEYVDITKTEFAFNCVTGDGIVRHSFGTGGFDASEEFDTDVKCDRCDKPAPIETLPAKPALKKKKTKRRHHEEVKVQPKERPAAKMLNAVPGAASFTAQRRAGQQQQSAAGANAKAQTQFWPFTGTGSVVQDVARYGPNGCVSTYKNAEDHCIVQTDCEKSNMKKYEFGIVCVDKTGAPVRHLFGKDSFDSVETFDTLIKCDQCLGLEDVPDDVAMNGEINVLSGDVSNLKDMMKNISINVKMLNAEVFKAGPAPAPAPAAGAPAAKAPKALLNHHVEHHTQAVIKSNLRHSNKHREEDDDDSDDDDEDDDRFYGRSKQAEDDADLD